jgi:hypothetical protein
MEEVDNPGAASLSTTRYADAYLPHAACTANEIATFRIRRNKEHDLFALILR